MQCLKGCYWHRQHSQRWLCHNTALRACTPHSTHRMPLPTPCPLPATGDPHELSYAQLTDLLLSMPGEAADREVAQVMRRLNFCSTYAFSKLLTEQMVDDPAVLSGVAKAIVRPSLIASMAGAPYPG